MPNWYLARTKPLSEYRAAHAMERDGWESYFPLVKTYRPRSGSRISPLFPSYLFVRVDRDRRGLPSIRRMPGLIGWVQFDGAIPEVPDGVVADLKRRLEEIDKQGGTWARYKPGEMVRVVSGKMDSLAEVVEGPKSPQSRVRVLLEFMGRHVPASLPWADLRPVEETAAVSNMGRPPRRTRGNGRWINGFGPRADVNLSRSR